MAAEMQRTSNFVRGRSNDNDKEARGRSENARKKSIKNNTRPDKTDNEYRRRTNCEAANKLGGADVVRRIKQHRARWLGHVWRARNKTKICNIPEWQPGGRKRRGRPRTTWLQEVKADVGRTGIYKW
ncbi:hypothetical protein Trydic_g7468 [Trypoxylus dichotomus]